MKKRIVCIALCFLILCPILVPSVGAESAEAAYYRLNVFETSDSGYGTPIDFMIINEHAYIQAEQLGAYLGFDFILSTQDCCLINPESNTAYVFIFEKRTAEVYMSDRLIEYSAPFNNLYLDGVAWLPFNYTCALLGISAHSRTDGLLLLKPELSLTEVIAMVHDSRDYYRFDMISEIGYANWSYMVTSISGTIVNFLDGLLPGGDSYNTLGLDLHAGIYNDNNMRAVADAFVSLTAEELEAYALLDPPEIRLAADMSTLGIIDEMINSGGIIADELDLISEIYTGIEKADDALLAVMKADIQNMKAEALRLATLNPNYSKACLKYQSLLGRHSKISASASAANTVSSIVNNLWIFRNDPIMKEVGVFDVAAFTVNVYSYMERMSSRDESFIRSLKKYSKASDYRLAYPLNDYASSMKQTTEWYSAIGEYLEREGWSLVTGKAAAMTNPVAPIVLAYNAIKTIVPAVRNSFASMENHELARYAALFQDDSLRLASDTFYSCFSNDSINENKLYDLAGYTLTFLKFSMTARNYAIESVDKCPSIDAHTKEIIVGNMKEKNREIAYYLALLSHAAENNDTFDYGFLPSASRKFQLEWRSIEPTVCQLIETIGVFIESSVQTSIPDETVDLRNAISEEEAIELAKQTLTRGSLSMLDGLMGGLFDAALGGSLEELLSFQVVDTYKVHKEDGAVSDCYVIGMATGGTVEEMLFFVTLDGKDVWLGLPYDNAYYVLYQVDMLHFNPMDLLGVIAELESILIQDALNNGF